MSEPHNQNVESGEGVVDGYDPDEDQDTEATNTAPAGERPSDQESTD